MLILPIRTDTQFRRTPAVNYFLIIANVLIFLVVDVFSGRPMPTGLALWKRQYMLDPENLSVIQFFSYQFLHGDLMHLLGNMLFLWVFGNAVNSKMGHVTYLLFYLACGVFAGLGFSLGGTSPCLGASGSIAGITTSFLVLFPRAHVTVVYWFVWFIGTAQIQALLLIVVKIILWDNILAPSLAGGRDYVSVAYSAHIAGYIFGFLCCALMLLIRALPRDQYDIIAMGKRYYQRQQYRAMMADPNVRAQMAYGRVARPVAAESGEVVDAAPEPDGDVVRLRGEIAEQLEAENYEGAATRYAALLSHDSKQCLPRRQMLDVANHLMRTAKYPQAAEAYEKFLLHYPSDGEAQQVQLVLGILYAKYLEEYEKAQRCLNDSLKRLTNPDLIRQATDWLESVTASLGRRGPRTAS